MGVLCWWIEHLGVDVDLESFCDGEYENYRHETSKIRMQEVNKALKNKALSIQVDEKESNIENLNKSLKTALNYNPKD